MVKYKIYIENIDDFIRKEWSDDEETVNDFIVETRKTIDILFDNISECWLDLMLILKQFNIKLNYDKVKICSIKDQSITFIDLKDVSCMLDLTKVFIDKSILSKTNKYKEYYYIVKDYNTGEVLSKTHMSNITYMLNSSEEDELINGKQVFSFPKHLLKIFHEKPFGFGNRNSDYYKKKRKDLK